MRYLISYDLVRLGKDYQSFWNALTAIGAQRILMSQWIVRRTGTTAAGLHDHLRQHIDANDRLLVTELDGGGWAGWNLLINVDSY